MPVIPEVMEIIGILNEEGFGALGGEMLIEMNVGREFEAAADEVDAVFPDTIFDDHDYVDLGEGRFANRSYFDENGGRDQPDVAREPIPDNEQLRFAAEFLRLRLVAPVNAWAEAEQIAGEFLGSKRDVEVSSKPVRIAFERPSTGAEDAPVRMARNAEPGTTPLVNELVEVLTKIANLDI